MVAGPLCQLVGGAVTNVNALDALARALSRPALQLISVVDRGQAGRERVCLKVNNKVNLAEYLLLIGFQHMENDALPLHNQVLWLGNHSIDRGYWVFIYTGPGQQSLYTTTLDTKEPALVLHWGQPYTLFNSPSIVPCLVHLDPGGVQIGRYSQ